MARKRRIAHRFHAEAAAAWNAHMLRGRGMGVLASTPSPLSACAEERRLILVCYLAKT
jgi:hypothetical protein